MQAIGGISDAVTIFMVAHRLSTLRNCDRIIEVSDGKISRVVSYAEIISSLGDAD